MIHNREWFVAQYDDVSEVADRLTSSTWTLCSGFQIGDVLLLNDSFSEDGGQEYAVIRALPDGTFKQIESVTVSWLDSPSLCEHIEGFLSGQEYNPYLVQPRITYSREHRCGLCE